MGIEYALVLGILGGVVNIIPFAGPFIAAVPVILLSLLQLGDTRLILPIIVVSFIVQQLDEIFIQPNVYGKILNIHPLTIILVILIANELLGVGGMIVAIPIYTIISVTAKKQIGVYLILKLQKINVTNCFDIETLGYKLETFDQEQQDYLLKFAEGYEGIEEAKQKLSLYALTAQVISIAIVNPDTGQGKVLFQSRYKRRIL